VFIGFAAAVAEMRERMTAARASSTLGVST
jgi:hypothetical protein